MDLPVIDAIYYSSIVAGSSIYRLPFITYNNKKAGPSI